LFYKYPNYAKAHIKGENEDVLAFSWRSTGANTATRLQVVFANMHESFVLVEQDIISFLR
jgi:hypothetical protein